MSVQTIYRVAYRHRPYSQLGNSMLQDERLSPEATHILVFVLSLPITWIFNLGWVASKRRMGRDRARRAVRELESHGYCQRRRGRGKDGRLRGYEYFFTDEPQHLAGPQPDDQVVVDVTTASKPVTGEPRPEADAAYKEKHQSRKETYKKGKLRKGNGTEDRLPFASSVVAEINALGLNAEALIERYLVKTRRRHIADPSAYLLAMARDELAKRVGVSAEDVKRASARNNAERAAALVAASGVFDKPSADLIAKVRKTSGNAAVDAALTAMSGRKYRSAGDADRAFGFEVANARMRERERTIP
jgi:DNA-binding MarR family transcriptional regulator